MMCGIVDLNLSFVVWCSGWIVNVIVGVFIYEVGMLLGFVDWLYGEVL